MKFVIPAVATALILAKIFGVSPVSDWSWWLVTSPLWVPLLVLVVVIHLILVVKALQ